MKMCLAAADKRRVPANGQKTANCRWFRILRTSVCTRTFSAHFVRIHLPNWYVISVRPFICHSQPSSVPVQSSHLCPSPQPLATPLPHRFITYAWLVVAFYSGRQQFLLSTTGGIPWSGGGRHGKSCASSCWASKFKVEAPRGAPHTQLGVVPVTCQSGLFLAGHINLNNEKSPRVGVEVED